MKNVSLLLAACVACLCGASCSSTKTSLAGNLPEKTSASAAAVASLPRVPSGPAPKRQIASRPPASQSAGRMMTVRTTAYSCKENEKGGIYGNKNACGTVLRYGAVRSAAADWSRFPVGTKFKIAGQPQLYVVDDYGSALVGTNTIDIYKPTIGMMNDWGVRHVDIQVVEWGSLARSAEILKARTHVAHTRTMYHACNAKLSKIAARAGATSGTRG